MRRAWIALVLAGIVGFAVVAVIAVDEPRPGPKLCYLADQPEPPSLHDFTGDGKRDHLHVVPSLSTGTFLAFVNDAPRPPPPPANRSGAYYLGPRAVADLDADGDLDVVTSGLILPAAKVNALLNDGTGTFSLVEELSSDPEPGRPPDHQANDIEAVDLDADRLPDLVMDTFVGLVVAWNTGGGRFEPFQPVAGAEEATGLAVGDVEGDGDMDVMTILYEFKGPDKLAIVRNERTRRLPPPEVTLLDMEHAAALESGDIEGDGVLDVVLGWSGRVTLLRQIGDRLDQSGTHRSGVSPHEVLIGDVDGDGDRDLALTRVGDQMGGESGKTKLRVLYNRGAGRFSRPARILDDPLARAMFTDDRNGDGRVDITMGDTFHLSAPRGPGATCL